MTYCWIGVFGDCKGMMWLLKTKNVLQFNVVILRGAIKPKPILKIYVQRIKSSRKSRKNWPAGPTKQVREEYGQKGLKHNFFSTWSVFSLPLHFKTIFFLWNEENSHFMFSYLIRVLSFSNAVDPFFCLCAMSSNTRKVLSSPAEIPHTAKCEMISEAERESRAQNEECREV